MKSFEGYLKQTAGDTYVLLAGGGIKPLSELLVSGNYVLKTGDTMTGALTIRGVLDSQNNPYGGYDNRYNNIILYGDETYGVSGISFMSYKGATNIDSPSDIAFIQYHAHGVSASALGNTPVEASSGEKGRFVIGVGDDLSETMTYDRVEPDGTFWKHIVHHNNPASKLFNSTDNFANGVYLDEDRWFDVYANVRGLSRFEFMVILKPTVNDNESKYRWVQSTSPLTAVYNDVAPSAVTRITTAGYTDGGYGGIYILNNNTHLCITNGNNGNWWGALGCWTHYGRGLPGYPLIDVGDGYIDLYVRVYPSANSSSSNGDELWLQTLGPLDLKHVVNNTYTYVILDSSNWRGFIGQSDINKKSNIVSISDLLPLYSFNWKENGKKSYGFIALDLKNKGYADIVGGEEGNMYVDYNAALSMYLAKLSNIVEENNINTNSRINLLEKRILDLELENQDLKNKLEKGGLL